MLRDLEAIAIEAGKLILRRDQSTLDVRQKCDGSPVSDADEAAEAFILRGLEKLGTGFSIVSEESGSSPAHGQSADESFFLVDPLDGTKEFVRGKPDYTVNICLVENRRPKIGVVFAPARRELFSSDGVVSYHCRLTVEGAIGERAVISRSGSPASLIAVASASHSNGDTEEFLRRLDINKTVSVGSSLKFCLVAASQADIYPRLGRTMQWDTAAGDAVLRGAGGCTLALDGKELEYSLRGATCFENPYFVSFGGRPEQLRELLRAAD